MGKGEIASPNRTGRLLPLWVIRVGLVICAAFPIYTQHRTFPDPVGTSQ